MVISAAQASLNPASRPSSLVMPSLPCSPFFFFNDTATTEIYTLSLHDALPICESQPIRTSDPTFLGRDSECPRSEEHTSELQSHSDLVCRLLLEKKKEPRIKRKHDANFQPSASSHDHNLSGR